MIGSGVLAGAALGSIQATAEAEEPRREEDSKSHGLPVIESIIDVNVDLFRWPLRRLRFGEPDALANKLRSLGVEQAWAGSFEALLHKDLGGVNARLAEACRTFGSDLLVPFGSVNPVAPDWEDELRRCHDEHKMPGIRLYPNYHGYDLDDPNCARLFAVAEERGLIIQLAVQMEDERMMHPLLRVTPVDTTPLPKILEPTPKLRLILLNALGRIPGPRLKSLMASGEVYLEIATLEGVGGIGNLLGRVPLSRVLFGSHAPLFYFESALLKLKETPLSREQIDAIAGANARNLIADSA